MAKFCVIASTHARGLIRSRFFQPISRGFQEKCQNLSGFLVESVDCCSCASVQRTDRFPLAEQGARVDPARMDLLVRLLSRHQDKLFRYIFAILPHEEDARDVLQETCVALARKFDEYDVAKPFLAWAYRFAYLEVLKQRERARHATLRLTSDLMEHLAREREEHESVLEARLQALDLCLQELIPLDREMLRHRYELKTNTVELAQRFGLSRRTLFRKLDHIRAALSSCITRRLARGAL